MSASSMCDVAVAAAVATAAPFSWVSVPAWSEPGAAARGPLALSNWVIPGVLCVGGYPSAMAPDQAATYAQAITDAGIDTVLNLMQNNELKRFRQYAGLMEHYYFANNSASSPAPSSAAAVSTVSPRRMDFLHYPIEDRSIPEDGGTFLGLVAELVSRLVGGSKVYVHCWGGHGRTGTLVSVLLAALYPGLLPTPDHALDLCQRLHASRAYNPLHRSPEDGLQKKFVVEMVARVRQHQAQGTYQPPHGFKIKKLQYTPWVDPLLPPPSADTAAAPTGDDSSSSGITHNNHSDLPPASDALSKRERVRARASLLAAGQAVAVGASGSGDVEPPSPPRLRAGGGSGVIVVDPFGTASTTQALSAVPSTPLMSPAVRRASVDNLKPLSVPTAPTAMLLQRHMIAISDLDNDDQSKDTSSSSSSTSTPATTAAAVAAASGAVPPPFTLLTFNTLADSLCNADSFPHASCPAGLDWSLRRHLLLDELTGANRCSEASPPPDILCLQECDHFADWFQPQLALRGFTRGGHFQGKFASPVAGGLIDGLAVFVRPERFRVRRVQKIQIMPGMNQVAMLLQLEPLLPSSSSGSGEKMRSQHRLYVVTTHLKAKEGFELVRLKQVQTILAALQSFIARFHTASFSDDAVDAGAEAEPEVEEVSSSSSSNPPHASLGLGAGLGGPFKLPPGAAVVFAGDWNDVPDSPMAQFVASGASTIDTSLVGAKEAAASAARKLAKATAAAAAATAATAAATSDAAMAVEDSPRVSPLGAGSSSSVLGLLTQQSAAASSASAAAAVATAASTTSVVAAGASIAPTSTVAVAVAGAAADPSGDASVPSPAPVVYARHSFRFHSLYNRLYDPSHGSGHNHPGALYTTVKLRKALVQRCIDFLQYTPESLTPTAMLSIPDANRLPNYLPDTHYPSDHLAIAGRFQWKSIASGTK